VRAFGEVGAGLQMSPNAARVLSWLGLLDRLRGAAVAPEAAELRDGHSGQPFFCTTLGERARHRWGAPYLHLHRADLHAALRAAARDAGAEIVPATPVKGYAHRPEGVRLTLADGTVETGQLLIGADGIRSALRTALNGPEAPAFAGQVAWRGTLAAEAAPEGMRRARATVWAGPGRHLVTYLLRGGALVNFVAVEEVSDWAEEGWSAPGDPAVLAERFGGWHADVAGLLGAVRETFRWGLFTRPHQVRWVDGRLALIGDAAHPMLPFLAQGAAMALEDVAVLLRALDRAPDVPAALLDFETERWSRVSRVQARSRLNGLLYHRRTGLGRMAVRLPFRAAEAVAPAMLDRQLDWLYGHDAVTGGTHVPGRAR
jgi:salicylate hydroxylase